MVKKTGTAGRVTFLTVSAGILFAILLVISYLISDSIFNLYTAQPSDRITQWKFISGKSEAEISQVNLQWKFSDSVFKIKKPLMDRFILLRTQLKQNDHADILVLTTQSSELNVSLNGEKLVPAVYGSRFTRTRTEVFQLPEYYDGQELVIKAKSSLVFDLKAAYAEQSRFSKVNEYSYLIKVAAGLVLALIGFITFLVGSMMSIRLRRLGRLILSGVYLVVASGVFVAAEILPFDAKVSDVLLYKSQFALLMILIPFLFGTTLYTAKCTKLFPKILIGILVLPVYPYLLVTDRILLDYIAEGYAVLVLIATLLLLYFNKNLLTENLVKKKYLYFCFLLIGICTAYDFYNAACGVNPGAAGFFIFAYFLYYTALTNLTISEAIYVNVRIHERNEQIKRNSKWIERIVSACASIFVKQELGEFSIQTAVSIRNLILDDLQEKELKLHQGREEKAGVPSISVAVKKDNSFVEIYNEGNINDCKYDMLEHKHTGKNRDGVYFGGSYMVIPLYVSGKTAAILYFEEIQGGISDNLRNIIMTAYSNISIALDNLKLKSDIVETQQSVFIYLAEMSEAKSEETGLHIKRVSEYVKTLCRELEISREETEIVTRASMMHDLGKLAIPEEVIRKNGELNSHEYEIVKQHVVYGHNMLSKSQGAFMQAAAVIAQQHHEKWNGEGYLGMHGEQIHLYARITAVADVFDALMSKRSYKDAWSAEEASGFILAKAGTDFDPMVAKAFARCIDQLITIKNENMD